MKRRSSACSTRWPRISNAISISTACSSSRDEKSQKRIKRDLQRGRTPEERKSAPDIGGIGIGAAAAHKRAVDFAVAIDARAAEFEAEGAGHRRLRPTGIRREMFGRIAQSCPYGVARGVEAIKRRRQRQEKCRETRRGEIDEIVESRRGPTEIRQARRAMPHHAIGRIDGLIDQTPGQTAESEIKRWRHDAIRKIFGKTFDCGPRKTGLIKIGGRPPDD